MFKSMISLALTILTGMTNYSNSEPFTYRYEIYGRSYLPSEIKHLYWYKEKVINNFELLAFNIDEKELVRALKSNLYLFEFGNGAKASIESGVLKITLSSCNGTKIAGQLRRNECDSEPIREKVFIFDFFG